MSRALTWSLPALRPHAGALLGNGVQGLMVWGGGDTLCLTVGRAGFWDHRGGNDFAAALDFPSLRRLLEAGDEAGLRAAFARHCRDGVDRRPQQLGAGRLELSLPVPWQLEHLVLDCETAELAIVIAAPDGRRERILLRQAVDREWAELELPADLAPVGLSWIPVVELIGEQLQDLGLAAPERWQEDGTAGYLQRLPEDEPLACAWRRSGDRVVLATALGADAAAAVRAVLGLDREALLAAREAWWSDYWDTVPRIQLPDPVLQELVDYGLYKLACATPPQGLACTLQGPFLEDYQIPPWSCDYHFNINIQMIYWPVLASGRFAHFTPLWDLLRSWWSRLHGNGRAFFGTADAIMLPHAVDDRCQAVGTFWTGTIDHACTAWMAQLAFLHWRYSGETEVLREVAWPLLLGAFRGYQAMLEEVDDGAGGRRWSLPVSVSPEYRGSAMDAWGRDASFQLAALHMLCRCLPQAAAALGSACDPAWAEVASRLPPYTLVERPRTREHGGSPQARIGLWQGQDLDDSHRHHSHLGGIYPFGTIDPADPAHARVVEASLFHWVRMGAGAWSGWCVPWAAIINARVGRSDGAIAWLHWWAENFVNEGRGTLHDAAWPGPSTLANRRAVGSDDARITEVMQLDAGFGALNAIYELLLQCRADGIHILPGRSRRWTTASFDGLWAEGGFVCGAKVRDGALCAVRVRATRAGRLVLHHGLGEACLIDGQLHHGAILERELPAEASLVLERA